MTRITNGSGLCLVL